MLIANTRQSTVADITSRIDKKLQQPMGFTVGVVASVMSIGNAPHNGSPREGTKRTRTNSPHRKILAAR
jgi:hypothetical protein